MVLGEEKDMEGGLKVIRGRERGGRMEELEGCDNAICRRAERGEGGEGTK